MSLPDNIKKGVKIRNNLGGHFEEMKMLRLSIWATYVLSNKDDFSEEEITNAENIRDDMLEINNKINQM